ncbi:histone -like [Brachionus plicatilis]|uniref:Histone-like n=1 Tax=Brachionus plicatilis TaxID=10195 RepID=A0A3M7S131_BRAPC|nr:histone -like [Brachionus plicatilis]
MKNYQTNLNSNSKIENEADKEIVSSKFGSKMKKIDRIIEKIDKKYAHNNGFKDFDIENMEEVCLKNGEIYQNETNNFTKKTLFNLVKNGDLEKLDDLLSIPKVDINLLWFSENLLMHAIRHKNEKIAEYLIFKGINFDYEAKLMEFNEKTNSMSFNSYSCRQMAYDNELYDIVDLIDICNCQLKTNLRCFLINRYLNKMNEKYMDRKIFSRNLKKRIELGFENNINKLSINDEVESVVSNEKELMEEIDLHKPQSDILDDFQRNDLDKFDSKINSSLSFFKNDSEINQKLCENLYEVRRNKASLKSLSKDKIDYHKNSNVNDNVKVENTNKKLRNSKNIYQNRPKTNLTIFNQKLTPFDSKTIYYKKTESVVPLNKLEIKNLTKKKKYPTKAMTESYYKIKSPILSYPNEKSFIRFTQQAKLNKRV